MSALEGKVVIVTGAGRGVGRGHALYLASLGATVIVNDLGVDVRGGGTDKAPAEEVVDLIKKRGGKAAASYEDISDWNGAKRLVRQAIDEFGRLDGIVNNAGILLEHAVAEYPEDAFDALMRIHVKGTFATTRHACEYWKAEHDSGRKVSGAIVNTVSDAMLYVLADPVYGAAKAAIAHLTMSVAIEAAKYGVRVNATAPRAFTRMSVQSALVDYPAGTVAAEPESYTGQSPKNPANSSPLVAWLLSDRSSHVSGQIFRTLAGAFAICEAWQPKELQWPAEGRMQFEFEELDQTMNTRVFKTQRVPLKLDFAPTDDRKAT